MSPFGNKKDKKLETVNNFIVVCLEGDVHPSVHLNCSSSIIWSSSLLPCLKCLTGVQIAFSLGGPQKDYINSLGSQGSVVHYLTVSKDL